jgi:hypothetical protein
LSTFQIPDIIEEILIILICLFILQKFQKIKQRINHSSHPRDVLQAIETIYEYLPCSLFTEIRITKQNGTFCTPTSGTSPSPPPFDVRAQQSVMRKFSHLVTKRTTASIKNRCRSIPRSLDDIRNALRAAKQTAVILENQEKPKTYQELYQNVCKARKNEAICAWHMLGMKLREDGFEMTETEVSTLFRREIPDVSTKSLENSLGKARRIYDITFKLSCNQILSLKRVTAEDLKSVAKKNLCKIIDY